MRDMDKAVSFRLPRTRLFRILGQCDVAGDGFTPFTPNCAADVSKCIDLYILQWLEYCDSAVCVS